MSAFYHDSMDIRNPGHREIFAHRIIAKLPTIAAAAYKHSLGQPFVYPQNRLDYCSNLLHMFFAVPSDQYKSIRSRPRRSICCSSCTRTTSRTQHLDRASGRQHGHEPLLGDRGRDVRAVGPGAWRRE